MADDMPAIPLPPAMASVMSRVYKKAIGNMFPVSDALLNIAAFGKP